MSPGRECSDTDMELTASQSLDCEPTPPLHRHGSKNNFYLPPVDSSIQRSNILSRSRLVSSFLEGRTLIHGVHDLYKLKKMKHVWENREIIREVNNRNREFLLWHHLVLKPEDHCGFGAEELAERLNKEGRGTIFLSFFLLTDINNFSPKAGYFIDGNGLAALHCRPFEKPAEPFDFLSADKNISQHTDKFYFIGRYSKDWS